jgi:hypothetical protein
MRIYFTGAPLANAEYLELMEGRDVMFSYVFRKRGVWRDLGRFGSVVLDSGAYSVWRKGTEVDLGEYAELCAELEGRVEWYANLDAIGDWRAGVRNLSRLEARGLSPVPVFHLGEPWGLLDDFVYGYPRVALGRGPRTDFERMYRMLEFVFDRYTDDEGEPLAAFHGFRMTDRRLLARFPFESVDSTTWAAGNAYGELPTDEGRSRGFSFLNEETKARVWLEFFDRAAKASVFDRRPRAVPALRGRGVATAAGD